VPLDEELARVAPVVRELSRRTTIPISVDTTKAEVARRVLAAGAAIINDITAGRGDSDMVAVVRSSGAGVILMHMQGTPETMQQSPTYSNVVSEVRDFLTERVRAFVGAGVPLENIAIDPGIGFGKAYDHNLTLLRHLDSLSPIARPVVLGVSRKGFLGQISRRPVEERVIASIAAACYCSAHGSAHVLRVHDVAATVDAAKVIGAIAERA
jgi:dihydropteroate synthase